VDETKKKCALGKKNRTFFFAMLQKYELAVIFASLLSKNGDRSSVG
jgi:hypothetical protein